MLHGIRVVSLLLLSYIIIMIVSFHKAPLGGRVTTSAQEKGQKEAGCLLPARQAGKRTARSVVLVQMWGLLEGGSLQRSDHINI